MKKVITIGSATQDIFINYKDKKTIKYKTEKYKKSFIALEEGSKIEVANISYSTGGGATNSAASFSRLGITTSIYCNVANDNAGNYIIKELVKENIDTKNIIISSNLETAKSFILPSLEHNYTALCYRGASDKFDIKDINFEILKNYDQVYITSLAQSFTKNLLNFTKKIKKNKSKIILNPGTEQLIKNTNDIHKSLKNIDIFILNYKEAQLHMEAILNNKLNNLINFSSKYNNYKRNNPELLKFFINYKNKNYNIEIYFKEILQLGPKIVIVTNGKEGVYLATENYILFHPSIKTKVISTLGAGDAFGSCFTGSLLLNVEIEKALVYGIINSASVISYKDTKLGLLTLEELEKRFKEISYKNIIKLNF